MSTGWPKLATSAHPGTSWTSCTPRRNPRKGLPATWPHSCSSREESTHSRATCGLWAASCTSSPKATLPSSPRLTRKSPTLLSHRLLPRSRNSRLTSTTWWRDYSPNSLKTGYSGTPSCSIPGLLTNFSSAISRTSPTSGATARPRNSNHHPT